MAAIPLSPAQRRAYEGNIRKFYLFRFLTDCQFWLPIWVIYLTDHRSLSLTEITVLDNAFWVILVFMEVPTGAIADRYGRRVSLMYGALANTVAIAIFGLADSYGILLASYLAWGIAWTLFSGADSAFFYDSLRALGREGEYQKLWGRCFAIQSAGGIAGLLIGAPLAAWTNLPTPILLSAGLMGAAWLVTLSFREPPRHAEGEHQLGYTAGLRLAVNVIWHTCSIRYFMPMAATIVALGMCVSILRQPFFSSHGFDVAYFGLLSVPGSFLSIAIAIWAHRFVTAIGLNRVVLFLPLLVIAGCVGLGAFDTPWAIIFFYVSGMAAALAVPLVSDYLNKRIPGGQRATILSFYQLMFSLILAGFEPLLGVIADRQGLPVTFRVAGIVAAVTTAPLIALWLRAVRHERALPVGPPAAEPAT